MNDIYQTILSEIKNRHDAMLVTIVENNGSAPGKTGARMLVGRTGRIAGTIGGGAIERKAEQMAQEALNSGKTFIHDFSLNVQDKDQIGMVCGGEIRLLFSFIDAENPLWEEVCIRCLQCIEAQEEGWIALSLTQSRAALYNPEGKLLAGSDFHQPLPDTANRTICAGGLYWMPIPVSERAILFGGGHIALALAPLLSTVNFRVTVFDNRPEYADKERFPAAENCITGDYTNIKASLSISPKDYIVVMTNGHAYDLEVQDQLLRGSFAYIGVIGSARKTAAVNAKLRERGISEDTLRKVHTPIGTPIKAVTPEEIAISIAGEMICERASRREQKTGILVHRCPMHE